eukprot:3493713-Prymnesium_polylepis.1
MRSSGRRPRRLALRQQRATRRRGSWPASSPRSTSTTRKARGAVRHSAPRHPRRSAKPSGGDRACEANNERFAFWVEQSLTTPSSCRPALCRSFSICSASEGAPRAARLASPGTAGGRGKPSSCGRRGSGMETALHATRSKTRRRLHVRVVADGRCCRQR